MLCGVGKALLVVAACPVAALGSRFVAEGLVALAVRPEAVPEALHGYSLAFGALVGPLVALGYAMRSAMFAAGVGGALAALQLALIIQFACFAERSPGESPWVWPAQLALPLALSLLLLLRGNLILRAEAAGGHRW